MSISFEPGSFRPPWWLASGHLQTVWQLRELDITFAATIRHQVDLPDGDAIVIHDDSPEDWKPDGLSVLLIHGLCGCHASPYMLRFARALHQIGVRTFRMDMRGCGAAIHLARNVTHAGRSDDCLAALASMATLAPSSSLGIVGVSLGGNQLLRAVGRVGAGLDPRPDWWQRLRFAVAVSPPIDLRRCSERMQRWRLRPYNRHFIDHLLARIPAAIGKREDFKAAIERGRPKTLWEFDDAITAPLSGFGDAAQYYHEASATRLLRENQIPTLLIAAHDDPIVPIECFADIAAELPSSTQLVMPHRGGHAGFVGRRGESWLASCLVQWTRNWALGGMAMALVDLLRR